jgi:hypothetical protein
VSPVSSRIRIVPTALSFPPVSRRVVARRDHRSGALAQCFEVVPTDRGPNRRARVEPELLSNTCS